jgi:hypothetical protein
MVLFSPYGNLHGEPIKEDSGTIGSGLNVLDLAVCIHEQCLGSLGEETKHSFLKDHKKKSIDSKRRDWQ